jgi:hypothetical protein
MIERNENDTYRKPFIYLNGIVEDNINSIKDTDSRKRISAVGKMEMTYTVEILGTLRLSYFLKGGTRCLLR